MKTYEKLAQIVLAEGVRSHFTLLGDANMHFAQTLAGHGVRTIHVRHEHNAAAMAMSFANADGGVGFCSVTCGPGLTQLMTALPAAVRNGIPLVVFAGESPMHAPWYNQGIDQAPFVAATGARYLPIHSRKLLDRRMREAFLIARRDRTPVVVGLPMDLQKEPWEETADYTPSTALLQPTGRLQPDPERLAQAAEMIGAARRIVVIGGRGAQRADAAVACRRLAERCGALLATTLPARGLFHDDPDCIGIAGGFAAPLAREVFAEADLIVAVGASLAQHMRDGGKLYPNAKVLQIDLRPAMINQGAVVTDLAVQGDARATLEALCDLLPDPTPTPGWRDGTRRAAVEGDAAAPGRHLAAPGLINPDEAVAALDRLIPKTWEVVNSSGHCSYFSAQMFGRPMRHFHTIREFGAIGNGLAYAMGVAVARPDTPVVLMDGDGSFLMHVQELETIRRHGLNILVCVLNDGAYGSEIHKLRADGLPEEGANFGRDDLGRIARGFGLEGAMVTDQDVLPGLFQRFSDNPGPTVWDIHINDSVASPQMQRAHPPHKA